MAPDAAMIAKVVGLEFHHPRSYASYGVIEPFRARVADHPATMRGFHPFAEDACGNAYVFADDGGIYFWDHEEYQFDHLTDTWDDFVGWCAPKGAA